MAVSKIAFFRTPQAADDVGVNQEGEFTFLSLMDNDLGGQAKTLYSLSADSQAALLTQASTGVSKLGASLQIEGDHVVYDSASSSALNALAEGETATDTFLYAIRLGDGTISTAEVTVTVTGSNDGPLMAMGDVTGAVVEAGTPVGSLTDSGSIAFLDADLTDVHTVGPVTASAGALGALTASVSADTTGSGTDGSVAWSYSVDANAVEYLSAGQTKNENFTFTLDDGHGGSVERTVQVTLTGTNDAPTIVPGATTAFASIAELPDGAPGENLAIHTRAGKIAFADVDLLDLHSATLAPQGSNYLGSLSLGAVDEAGHSVGWSFNVSDAALDGLQAGETRVQTYAATISDGHGGSVQQGITVLLTGSSDAARGDSFDAGLTGWTRAGSVAALSFSTAGGSPVSPTEGTYFAALATDSIFGGGEVSDVAIESFLGLAPHKLDSLGNDDATNGSAMKKTFHMDAGDTLRFDYRFDTADYLPFDDFGFVSIAQTGQAIELADIQRVGSFGDTGWQTYTYTAGATTDYTIGFGVVDTRDGGVPSLLYIDHLVIG